MSAGRLQSDQCLIIVMENRSKVHRPFDLLDLGPSASQSSDGDASAASRILVVSFLWATDLKCSRSFRLVSFSLSSDIRVRSLLRTTGNTVRLEKINVSVETSFQTLWAVSMKDYKGSIFTTHRFFYQV